MSVTHRTLGVAQESIFGSLSPTTNLPDNSGYTYISIPCEMDPILIYGEPVAQPWLVKTRTRNQRATPPPSPPRSMSS